MLRVSPSTKTLAVLGCTLLAAAAASFATPYQDTDKPWPEILGPSQAVIPDSLPDVLWRSDLGAARALAQSEN